MRAITLQSGSNGNCIYVEAAGARLLFDAGISGIKAENGLASFGIDIRDVDALVISHDHTDHIASAGVFQRKYGMPVYITPGTFNAAKRRHKLGKLKDIRHFNCGETLSFNDARIHTIPTPHDSADGSAFVIRAEGKAMGVMTDLGHAFNGIGEIIAGLDAVFLESNYDPAMLDSGPYPAHLKARIRGQAGHLSNVEAAGLLRSFGTKLKWACLAHLSEQNNTPACALEAHRRAVGTELPVFTASRYQPSGVFKL